MNLTIEQTQKLLTDSDLSFKSLGFSMLLTNLRTFHSISPANYPLEDCNAEINSFLKKFEHVMEADFEIIKKL